MNRRSAVRVAGMSMVLALSLILLGCGKSSSPTSPNKSTGGGGGNMTSGAFDSGTLTAPATFDHVFATAGSFGYHCTFHRSMGMVGTVVVAVGGASSVTVTGSGMTFSPNSVTIQPGGTVHWTITGGTHTVTSD